MRLDLAVPLIPFFHYFGAGAYDEDGRSACDKSNGVRFKIFHWTGKHIDLLEFDGA
jgi:hypothetical protein